MRAALVCVVVALCAPAVAAAHGGSGAGYVSKVTEIVGGHGIEAAAAADGRFELTPPEGAVVVVEGYEHEPYLRFADGKVFENANAPTTYVNKESTPPASATPDAPPDWVLQAGGPGWTWHDHRTHWMQPEPPAAVHEDEHARHHVRDWVVRGTADGAPFRIHGSLDWVPHEGGTSYEWVSFVFIGLLALYATYAIVDRLRARVR